MHFERELNVGELIHDGAGLTTREVVALLHQVCCQPGHALPQTPHDLWIAPTGELTISQSDQLAPSVDPRTAVANLLEVMLPADDRDPERTVPQPLRGLPARLRAASGDAGPTDRADLTAILSWHLGGDARSIIQQLLARLTRPPVEAVGPSIDIADAAAPAFTQVRGPTDLQDELALFSDHGDEKAPAGVAPLPIPRVVRQPRSRILSALIVGALFLAIGSASYRFFRERAVDQRLGSDRHQQPSVAVAGRIEGPRPPKTNTAPSTVKPNLTASAGALDPRPPQPLHLPVAGGAFSPEFSTSGREVFFHAGHSSVGRLLVASLDDNGQVSHMSALLDDRARNYHPRVSPDGRLLAFDSDRDGERGVYVSGRDGFNPQRVSGSGYAAVPSWSPNREWLAFVRGEAARPQVWNLWLRRLSSGAVQRHTSFRSGQVWGASWFPDGRSLCYSHDNQLVISSLDGRADQVIDTPRRGRLVRTPAVSPDGRRVVFQVFKEGVWLLDVQTRQMPRILDDPAAEEFSWAPDGDRIAYHSNRDGAWRIWTMSVQR